MNIKTVVPLSAAVVLGLVAAIVARQLVGQSPATNVHGVPSDIELTDIVVAARDISPGSTLSEGDLAVARVETKNAPTNVASTPSALFRRVAKIQIPKGQIVHEMLLAEAGVTGGLPGVIRPGYRAMTIEVNEFTGVAGLLQPGNRIDVLARFQDGDNGQTTRTVVQNIEIIAVGADLMNTSQGVTEQSALAPDQQPQKKEIAKAITVLVTPADAEKLDLASANQARLALRASLDTEKSDVSGATLASLRGDDASGTKPTALASRTPAETDTAETPQVRPVNQTGADDIFSSTSTPKAPTVQPPSNLHTITIIRGGVVSESQVEKSRSRAGGPQAGGGDMTAPLHE
jgi:pilus assembly protein CpaB